MSDLLRYWDQALTQPIGIKIKVSDRVLFRQQLYRARDASESKAKYGGLAIIFPNIDGVVYIVHKEQDEEG